MINGKGHTSVVTSFLSAVFTLAGERAKRGPYLPEQRTGGKYPSVFIIATAGINALPDFPTPDYN
jgi:hypothetical protein